MNVHAPGVKTVARASDIPAADLPQTKPAATPARATEPDARKTRLEHAIHANTGLGALAAGLERGFHWRLLLAWIMVLMLPTLIAALPAALWLHLQFGHAPQAAAIAAGREPMLFADALAALGGEAALLAGSTGFAGLLAIALSPWLTGMIVAQIRTVYRLRLGGVLRAGLGEYPRMLRMLLWSLVPMAAAMAIGLVSLWLTAVVSQQSLAEVFASPAVVFPAVLGGVLLLLAHATVEAGRGWLGADLALRSVFKAWKRGVVLLLRRPGATLTVYVGTSAVAYGLALLFAWLRLQVGGGDWFGGAVGFVLTQLVVASLAWGRSARLHGLADLATAVVMAQPAQKRSAEDSADDLRAATQRQPPEPAL